MNHEIQNYDIHLKTLVKRNHWKANNPTIVQLGVGTKNMARQMLSVGLVVDIIFSVAVNAVDTILRDDRMLSDFIGRTATDVTKGFLSTGIGTLAAVGITALFSVPIVVGWTTFAVVTFAANQILSALDDNYGISDALVEQLKAN
ncbi:hypothetical protein [Enterovibrio paralichthyis]|uniref:hypothetical protein n=1 Tax=Enterovibrio paralichthyis TaxID=2853805 RepID=UPI001C4741E2|nr:hypothetical protein [Enterovibrio paralichthyis]MBV7297371.1 hypothetical protein [Enterovibrio paralichthyis]